MTDSNRLDSLINVISNLQSQVNSISERLEEMNNNRETTTENVNHDNELASENNSYDNNTIHNEMKILKSYLNLITEFEGNNISVETFIFELTTTIAEIPDDAKNNFIRLIISQKIVKQARKMIDGHDIRSIEDLIQVLRNNFVETKSFDVATLERSQCQQNNDSVLLYNKKFNEIHLNVKRAINNNIEFDADARKAILKNEENQGMVQYIRGLRPNGKLFVKASQPKILREAQNLALETEKEEITSNYIYKKPVLDLSKISQNSRNTQNTTRNYNKQASNPNQLNTEKKYPCHGCEPKHIIKSNQVYQMSRKSRNPGAVFTINMYSTTGKRSYSLLADTGAEVNLIKLKCTRGLPVRKNTATITGINNVPVMCELECKITLDSVDHIFLVVPDNFPLTEDGIAGRPFLEKEDAIILSKQRKIIFKRTNPNYEILKFDSKYFLERSRLLQENTRLNHILNENEKNELWNIIDSFHDVYCLEGDPLPLR
ncbi:hypothetical protein PV328_011789 [Microctonus aethiopoides]|uniref:Peptidase A2 domain-containing protein n=1 Tax=Microctonus aethiopoides TaxID=144406 RepID=A0AA39KQ09_9HYME|nr:hypothetical protein PV328_011789 [Microctonus aethiopoides]